MEMENDELAYGTWTILTLTVLRQVYVVLLIWSDKTDFKSALPTLLHNPSLLATEVRFVLLGEVLFK